jgi:HAE1 family hydrophobic/amphiphilic exporter-1
MKREQNADNNPWYFFLNNWRFAVIVILAVVAAGVFSLTQIPKESEPNVDIPIAVITTTFPGASAADVEQLVTDEIEDQVIGLEDVDEVSSESRRGLSSITVQFEANADNTEATNELEDRVDLAAPDLPGEANDPRVQQISFSDRPVLRIALAGPYPVQQLKLYGDELASELERVSGVSNVRVSGGREREIQIRIDRAQLDKFNLSLGQVTNAIRQTKSDIPIGTIQTSGENYTLRIESGIESVDDIRRLPIATSGETTVFVDDVGTVEDTYADATTISRLSQNGSPVESSVSLSVFNVSGGDIVTTVDNVWSTIDEKRSNIMPENVTIETVEDNAEIIRSDLSDLASNGLQTVLIVMILLFIFLGWREAVLAGLAIPLSFLITFSLLEPIGYNLNFLTLFSLILALGIIVDAAIVMTEAVHKNLRQGMSKMEAAKKAVSQFNLPLIAGTLTTVFAFLPMVLTSGIMGEFIKSIPVTVTIVLLSALFVALGLIPVVSLRWLKDIERPKVNFLKRNKDKPSRRERLTQYLSDTYSELLESFLNSSLLRTFLAIGLTVAFIGSVSLPAVGLLNVNMFPSDDMDRVFIDMELPYGTPLEQTSTKLEPVESFLQNDPRVSSFLTTVGSGSNTGSIEGGGGSDAAHLASIVVNLKEQREANSTRIVEEWNADLPDIKNGSVDVTQLSSGPGDSAPVEVRIVGPDLDTAERIARDVETELASIDGATTISSTIEKTNGEFTIQVDRAKAQLYGLTLTDISSTMRNAVTGSETITVNQDNDELDVVLSYNLNNNEGRQNKTDLETLQSLTFATPQGEIPLSSIAEIRYTGSRAAISHLDGDRIVRVTSYTKGEVQPQTIFSALEGRIDNIDVPPEYEVQMGGEREDIQQSFTDMFRAMIIGVFMIAALLVLQFKSYRQPLFILATIPLALIGVLPGLFLVNQPVSFPAVIGIVALAGIVVNNAIILIDRINENRKNGMDKKPAIEEAAVSRLQPILLTTVTTVLGLVPLVISSPSWGPLGYSIIFGLLFSTVLTLLVAPLLYLKFGEATIS